MLLISIYRSLVAVFGVLIISRMVIANYHLLEVGTAANFTVKIANHLTNLSRIYVVKLNEPPLEQNSTRLVWKIVRNLSADRAVDFQSRDQPSTNISQNIGIHILISHVTEQDGGIYMFYADPLEKHQMAILWIELKKVMYALEGRHIEVCFRIPANNIPATRLRYVWIPPESIPHGLNDRIYNYFNGSHYILRISDFVQDLQGNYYLRITDDWSAQKLYQYFVDIKWQPVTEVRAQAVTGIDDKVYIHHEMLGINKTHGWVEVVKLYEELNYGTRILPYRPVAPKYSNFIAFSLHNNAKVNAYHGGTYMLFFSNGTIIRKMLLQILEKGGFPIKVAPGGIVRIEHPLPLIDNFTGKGLTSKWLLPFHVHFYKSNVSMMTNETHTCLEITNCSANNAGSYDLVVKTASSHTPIYLYSWFIQ